ncbi:DNA-binding transcriptional regulator, MarR family [Amycolatopsis marina]|uniref:DNA-binding transcriptional regulator, MarR family n=1 Tax=Amycolatopsis marina TaxID=490629 RepID=A0A1I0Z7W3_9PSEU|nr:MarR family transcriptional regulator [Amycolatopsis marina]SFB21186.1 DNA-binding transcriptional regulator, MarR family [Amycolatopsis marina]
MPAEHDEPGERENPADVGDAVDRMIAEWARRDPDLDASALHVIGRLLLTAEHIQRKLVSALRPLGLSYGDFDVVNTLRRLGQADGTNPKDLARSALITSGAMTTRLDRLERLGLVERRGDPGDRRGVLVRLTERGEQLAEHALTAVLAADEEFLEPIDGAQRDTLTATLKQLLAQDEAR